MSALPIEALSLGKFEAPEAVATPAVHGQAAGAQRLEQLSWRHARLRVHHRGLLQPGKPVDDAPEVQIPRRWGLAGLEGRLVEISGEARSAGLTLAVRLTAEAQSAGDIAAWVCGPDGSFYPPDLIGHGIDLNQLAVIRAPSAERVVQAAIRLAQSGGFGLVVLDLAGSDPFLPRPLARPGPGQSRPAGAGGISDAHLGRLVQQAQKHQATVICLTRKPAQRESLGSLVSVRAEGEVRRIAPDRFLCTVNVLKDKRHGAGWHHEEVFSGPPGLH